MDKQKLHRAIIMHNYQNPTQFVKATPKNYLHIHAKIDSCSDDFIIYSKLKNNMINDIVFEGEGCAISTSSLNLIALYLIGKSTVAAIEFIDKYRFFVMGKKVNEDNLEDLVVFRNIHKHLNRIDCGLMGPNHIKILLKAQND